MPLVDRSPVLAPWCKCWFHRNPPFPGRTEMRSSAKFRESNTKAYKATYNALFFPKNAAQKGD
jgi:hypothetical protein